MARKTLEELNLIDNFLFSMAFDHEEYGPLIAKTILETVLQRNVRIGKIVSEKIIPPQKPGMRGIRMDAYIQEDAVDVSGGDVFDLEPENKENEKKHLPKRTRFYHSRIDGKVLQAKKSFLDLPDSWVIFFTSFDPFGENRMVYTVRNRCLELPELNYDDGAVTLFLYVNGDPVDVPKALAELLRFIGKTTRENACNPELGVIQNCVDALKRSPEVKEAYMAWDYYIESEREEAKAEVREEMKEALLEANRRVEDADRRVEETVRMLKKTEAERDAALRKLAELKAR